MKNKPYCIKKIHTYVSYNELKSYLYWIVLFPPPLFERLGSLFNQLLLYAQFIAVVVLMIELVIRKRIMFTKNDFCWLLLITWGFLLTLIQCKEFLYQYIATIVFPVISIWVLFKVIFHNKNSISNNISIMANYFSILIWLNFALMLIFPKGAIVSDYSAVMKRANWLFGSKNNITFIAILMITILILDFELTKRKMRIATCILMMLEAICSGSNGTAFLDGSTTGCFIYFLFLIILILLNNTKIKEFLKNVFSNSKVLFLSIVMTILVWTISLNGFPFITKFLLFFGKDVGFSYRDLVWADLLNAIKINPLFGYGYNLNKNFYIFYSYTPSTYSFWGGSLYHFGIIGAIIYLNCLNIPKIKKITREGLIVLIGLMFYLVLGLMNDLNVKYLITFIELEYIVLLHKEKIIRSIL